MRKLNQSVRVFARRIDHREMVPARHKLDARRGQQALELRALAGLEDAFFLSPEYDGRAP